MILALSQVGIDDWHSVGVYSGCGITQRLAYSFFHASLMHAAFNLWCLLSFVFVTRISWPWFAVAFVIAVAAPDWCMAQVPTVGISAVGFALAGLIAHKVLQPTKYIAMCAATIIVSAALPGISAGIHLYSYAAGLLVGYTYHIACRIKRKLS